MLGLVVVDNPADWGVEIPGVKLISARTYLTDPQLSKLKNARVINLCRSYRYQSLGYYVSLLATARGHKPMPTMTAIQDMKSQTMIRFVSDDLDQLIQKSLTSIHSDKFTLSIYFGRNLAKKYDRLSTQLFNLFQAPCMRAHFSRNGKWTLQNLGPIAANDIPEEHRSVVMQFATEYFEGRRMSSPKKKVPRYDLAILVNPSEETPPSDEKALRRFEKAAELLDLGTEFIEKADYGHVAEFDALFIRETTSVNHHTYRFARRAAAEGLVVIDDPESILKCTNKVYLAELLDHHGVLAPRTMIVNRGNDDTVASQLGLPCILKQPDSSFSQGVVKVDTEEELEDQVLRLLEKSELIIAQEYLPTEFDWRVGILDRQPLYVCRYFMADSHWQIVKRDGTGKHQFGSHQTMAVELAPKQVIRTALKAANLIGDGLYGVDLKQINGKCYVIEVNDNPNVDVGVEDAFLKDELYLQIMRVFLKRIERRKEGELARMTLHLFEGFGIELEYMIVDRSTLEVAPISDRLIAAANDGEITGDLERGPIAWSNELVLHVLELKTNGPAPALAPLAPLFQQEIKAVNRMLEPMDAQLLPGGMHPFMDPKAEMKLWPHDYGEVYAAFDRVFDCTGHGWANLQSTHLNLPFAGDEEFGRLHAAVRLILPILPALAASSPIVEARATGVLDSRLEVYRHNAARVPSVSGRIVPEPVYTRRDYEERLLEMIYRDIAPHDPQGILRNEWINARGAIARFDRDAIEIRVLDVQECPAADLAILELITAAIRALVEERFGSFEAQSRWEVEPLAELFLEVVKKGPEKVVSSEPYLAALGFPGRASASVGELWSWLAEATGCDRAGPLKVVLEQGPLATRILRALGPAFSRARMLEVYRELGRCAAEGRAFLPA